MALDSVNARKYGITYRWGVLNAAYNKVGAIGHPGVDLGAKYAPVYAEFPGTVTDTITGHAGYGNYIRISDIDGDRWLYAHLSAFAVSKGQTVKRGQVIGTSGNTGMSTGPHLHLEVFPRSGGDSRYYGTVDPIAYLAKETRNIEDISLTGDTKMTPAEERNAYQIVLNRSMEHNGTGRTGYKFIVDAKAEVEQMRKATAKTITDLQTALKNEQSKPPKEVVKEVEKIVTEYIDRPVEVIKEVEKPLSLNKAFTFIIDYIKQKFTKG